MIRDLVFLKTRKVDDWMELVFDTTKEADTTNTVTLQIGGVGPGGVYVDWGDGTTQIFTTAGSPSRNYVTDGLKTVRIYGNLTRYGNDFFPANIAKLIAVNKFNSNTKSLDIAFKEAVNLVYVPAISPPGLTSLSFTFTNCTSLPANIDLSGWNVSNVTSFYRTFLGATLFNSVSIINWSLSTTSNINLSQTFIGSAFNRDISGWNTSKVNEMHGLFADSSFNQPIGNWNVSNVSDMGQMFENNHVFNQPIGNWNVSSLSNAGNMFFGASAFNQNLSSWITALTVQPTSFSSNANASWVAAKATKFPFLQDGVTRINT